MIGVIEPVMMRSLSFRDCIKNLESESVPTPKRYNRIVLQQSPSFKNGESESVPTPKRANKIVLQQSPSFSFKNKNWEHEKKLEASFSFNSQSLVANQSAGCDTANKVDDEAVPIAEAEMPIYQLASPSPRQQFDECATKVQKMYKGYRTRRQVADAAVIAEESWWQALDYASFYINSVSFYHDGQPEKAVSRWSRAKRRLAKVGKGLSKDDRAQKLAMQHWLEAIDPRHRYGHNLHFYYDVWFTSESTQPFFYWLDAGDGKKYDLAKCPRSRLQSQMIKYLGPKEREAYEVIVVNGRLIKKKEQVPVNTTEGSKWIFVLSTTRNLYVGQKKKGSFQHSSFLAGAATTAAGRLVAKDGHLQAIWPYSGHYKPTEANFEEFISFLVDNNVDLSNVKRCSMDEDRLPSPRKDDSNETTRNTSCGSDMVEAPTPKWSTGAGPRIGCVRDYPVDLQVKALEHVHLSPRVTLSSVENFPIPSPRPSPNMRLSPHMTRMGFSPRAYPADIQLMTRDNGSPKIVVSPIGSRIRTPSSCRRLPPTAFPSPNIQLRLPSMKGRRAH